MIEDGRRGRIDEVIKIMRLRFIKIMFISLTIYLLILLSKINNLNLILGNSIIIVLLINLFNFN